MLDVDVLTLGMAADEARRAARGTNIVTYERVHTVSSADLAAGTSVPEAASELRLHDTPASLDEAIAQLRTLASIAGGRRVAAFSMADIVERGWHRHSNALAALVDAGLQDVAELPVDRLADVSDAVGALRAAGVHPRRLTVSHPASERKVEIITRVQRVMSEQPSVRRFSPLPRVAPVDKPTTGYDDVRMVALARLALGGVSIEVDWSLYGPKLAQVALTFGADHLDAVPATEDAALGRRRATVEDVERNIRAAGFEPQEYRPVAAP
jgi:aminodeoxyfutalosine synthase